MKRDYGVGIIGVGHKLASLVDTNEELCKTLTNVTPEWILEKTGIKRRYLAEEHESASSLAVAAAWDAIALAGISVDEIDLIIACTFSGDYLFPPVSAKIQMELKAKNAQIFDLQANCTGFVTGLTVASDRMLADETVRNALVIGVELPTRYTDRRDQETAIFFSDGAGAAILGKVKPELGIVSSAFFTDSSNYETVRLKGGSSSFPVKSDRPALVQANYMEMNGLATWKQTTTHLPMTVKKALSKANITSSEVDFFLFHQANLNLIQYVVRKLGQPLEKTYTNVEEVGNTGSASLAIVLSEAFSKGLLKSGQTLVLAGVGAGFNFGSSVWKWAIDLEMPIQIREISSNV
jgi:3-oxoacyl-[acyl-carrier-protein] synthase-3